MNQAHVRVRNLFLAIWFMVGLVTSSFAFAQTPQQGDLTINMPVEGTDSSVDVRTLRMTEQQVRDFEPDAIRAREAQRFQARVEQCRKYGRIRGMAHEIGEEYPAEFVGFLIGMSGVTAAELAKDPARWTNYWDQNIADPWAHATLLVFVASQQLAETTMSLMGLKMDECRYYRKGIKPPPEAAIQKVFKPLIRPISMTFGAGVAAVVIDMAKNKDVQKCVSGLLGKTSKPEGDEGCTKAYADYIEKGQIRKFMPGIMSAFVGTILMESGISIVKKLGGKVLTAAESAEARHAAQGLKNVGTIVVKGARIVLSAGARFFAIGFVMEVAYTAGFFFFQKYLQPYFDEWWGARTTGQDVTISINGINNELDRLRQRNWYWKAKEKPKECDGLKNYHYFYYYVIRSPKAGVCFDKDPSLGDRVREFTERNQEWRKFLMREMNETRENWITHTLRFSNVYADSYRFYKKVTSELYVKKTEPRKQTWLGKSRPFDTLADLQTENICGLEGEAKNKMAAAILATRNGISEMSKNKGYRQSESYIMALERILTGLTATDCSKPLDGWPRRVLGDMRAAGDSDEEIKRVERDIRQQLYFQGIAQLDMILMSDARYFSDLSLPEGADLGQVGNPFTPIKRALGEKNPSPPGVATLNEMSQDGDIINQEQFKPKQGQDEAKHPYTVPMGNAGVERPTDYLLASMVCGPDGSPSLEQKVRAYQAKHESVQSFVTKPSAILEQPKSFFGALMNSVGLGSSNSGSVKASEIPPDLKQKAEDFYREQQAPAPELVPPTCYATGSFSLISRGDGTRASFCPPRLIPDLKVNFCESRPKNDNGIRAFNIHQSAWDIGNTRYVGFLDIVKQNVRTDIIGSAQGTGYSFPSWWKANVQPSAMKVIKSLRADYDNLMEQELAKVLRRKSKEEFYAEPNLITAADAVVLQENSERSFNGTPLDMGVNSSLRSEVNFYLKIIGSTLEASRPSPENALALAEAQKEISDILHTHLALSLGLLGDKATIKKAVLAIEKVMPGPSTNQMARDFQRETSEDKDDTNLYPEEAKEDSGSEITSIYQKRYVIAFEQNQEAFENAIKILEDALTKIEPQGVSPEAVATIRDAQRAAIDGLKAVVTETVGLHQLMSTLDMEMLR